jgi:hypothetical protein
MLITSSTSARHTSSSNTEPGIAGVHELPAVTPAIPWVMGGEEVAATQPLLALNPYLLITCLAEVSIAAGDGGRR